MKKKWKQLTVGTLALGMGLGTGLGVMEALKPVQEVEAMGAGVFGTKRKMATYRTVYYNTSGKKDAVYYKGTTYTVQKTYSNGYYKVYIKGEGYRYMKSSSVLGDKEI